MLDAQSLRRVRPGCAMPQVVPRVPAPAPYRPYDKISNRNRYECNLEEIISKLVNALIYTVLRKDGSGAGGGNGGAGGGSGGGAGGGSGSGAGGGSGGGAGGGSGGGAGGGNGSGGGAEKTDLSRLRGKEAAAELKRSKQQKLDEQKKTLDRKIQAREAANIISREKSTTAASKLSTKSSTNKLSEVSKSDGKIETAHKSSSEISGDNAGDKVVTRNDMGTQWDTEILPLEWEPNIPALPIPKDDSNKESMCIDTENNTEKKKRPNLFALSDEMPSSLRGSCYPIIINEPAKPSLTLVSEYIQNRALRLRETPVSNSNKKNSADLQNLKQTILRTRSLRAEDTRDVPFADEQIVVRDMHSNKDAYIEALSEAASNTEEKQNKKLQDVSTKIAVTRQSVEKEYKDTMAFLNGLPKSKGLSTKPIKNAYKDDYRLNQQKENRQKILQQEFKNMEKEASQQRYSYSWMPVPESDGNLAVHTIPTNVKEGKSGNNVKFSKVDSYHEYRSRHKHTPPTKDTGSHDKKSNKRVVEAVIIQHKPDDSSSGSSIASDNSSAEDITFDSNLNKYIDDNKSNDQLTDAERIIIYKILDNKKRRNDKMPRKSKVNDVIQQNGIDKDKITKSTQNENVSKVEPPRLIAAAVANDQGPTPFDELGEGIYKIENEKQKIGVSHKCKCNNISRCKSYSPIIHPSTNTSAASFKTATNIKTNNKHQEDKYIKVIDEGMKEKGNFYIGATGFLKDDAYEVVIQLRKKDTNKEEVKKYEDDIVTREKPASDKEKNTKEVLISTTECVEDGNGKVTNGSTNCYTEPSGNPKTSGSNCDLIIEDATTAESALQMDERIHCSKTVEPNNVIPPVTTQCAFTMHDRSVITPFRDSYVIPCHVPKSDAIPRPATSSYTQTTPSSPNPRPVFIHMSSSTSTAYMSPPEVVLPNFFKRGYESCNETHKNAGLRERSRTLAKKSNTGVSSSSTSPVSKVPSTIIESQTLRPINTSTQTSRTIGDEMNFMKLAEDKLHNMEKIADLTEKCTKRLSNLAKVLEEVRKNKSLAYSQISTSDSTDSDQKSDQAIIAANPEQQLPNLPVHVTGKNLEAAYESLLFGIPKPGYIESPLNTDSENEFSNNNNNEATPITPPLITTNVEYRNNNHPKYRTKPPPALLRMHLKRPEENVVPHELSTVIEVDSPLSVKLKNQSSNADNASQSNKHLTETRAEEKNDNLFADKEFQIPLAPSDSGVSNKSNIKILSTDSSEETKLQMMDLNQFNDIMLRPFISLQEYAQEYYGDNSNLKRESVPTNIGLIEDISSLHSDGSLPDVVAELLKRKLITEPFKFDTASNINSTTVSSESTLSVLALSRVRRNKTKTKVSANKENLTETSDTLSISSNPDLENAFKKLGMGWASSTLKKTKERLALSSSSNTSSSSLSQFKIKSSNKQDMPTIVTDSVSSVPNLSNKPIPERHSDTSKNAQQQTSLTNSMTVKEFLNKELAKKITFTNKTVRNDSHAEFVSLIETKIPDELKNSLHTIIGEISGDSEPSANNNRARTSTPVQIFKSPTYHSSSSSNISNGLFSNADDLSSVKLTSTSMRYHSASEKDELTIPNFSLKMRKGVSDCSKTDSC
ncbi:hypothetical protein MSG28_000539 [Choristoneura fumiferana]|uniref:Uncharacterized protein n=1 Tax=Choristoneura fumiferana TaxID=7141 RepID=A0ACC0K120_CHOFU|nr:hypothetical protein MSG28_000539 [Choristoneura fumiferana]